VSIRLIAALLAFVLFSALVFVFPVSVAADSPTTSTNSSSTESGLGPAHEGLTPGEMGMIAVVALLFASLGLLKDFHRYRGLLHILIWNFYSWLFLAFTTMCIFAADYAVLPLLHKVIREELMLHISLALGHTGVSAAFAYASPFMLSVIPTQVRTAPAEPSPKKPEKEKPTTEMNVVYAAIRESLENRLNGRVHDWTYKYSWPVIRSTGKMLLTDQLRSGMISQEKFEGAKLEEGSCQECADPCDNRQAKYDLLRIMMMHSSYHDLSSRLERTARAERAGTTA
jgi:hypothetical protein